MAKRKEADIFSGNIKDGQITLTTPHGSYVWLSPRDVSGPISGICVRFRDKRAAENFLRQIEGKSLRIVGVDNTPQIRSK